MPSIKTRLSLVLLLGSSLLLLISGLALNALVSAWLRTEFDQTLEAKARGLITLTKQDDDEIELDFADEIMPEFEIEIDPEYFQIWLGDGSVLEKSRSTGEFELSRHESGSSEPRFDDVQLLDGRRGRQVEIRFVPRLDDEDDDEDEEDARDPHTILTPELLNSTIVVAKGRDELDATISSFRWAMSGAAFLLTAAIFILVRVSIRVGLKPLEDMARQVDALGADSLASRIRVTDSPDEMLPLTEKLNDLLKRLDEAFHRERQLSSDLAHELRTPVSELRSLAEVGTRWPEDWETTSRFFNDVSDIAVQMEHTISNLLLLARYEGGLETARLKPVPLRSLIDTVWSSLPREVAEKDLDFLCEAPASLLIRTDGEMFQQVLINLLTNAVSYSPPGEAVSCRVSPDGDRAKLILTNSTDNLTTEDLPKMFERFWRKDPARSGSQHVGLGMSLVRAFADLLDLDLETSLDASPDGTMSIFRVELSAKLYNPSQRRAE